ARGGGADCRRGNRAGGGNRGRTGAPRGRCPAGEGKCRSGVRAAPVRSRPLEGPWAGQFVPARRVEEIPGAVAPEDLLVDLTADGVVAGRDAQDRFRALHGLTGELSVEDTARRGRHGASARCVLFPPHADGVEGPNAEEIENVVERLMAGRVEGDGRGADVAGVRLGDAVVVLIKVDATLVEAQSHDLDDLMSLRVEGRAGGLDAAGQEM